MDRIATMKRALGTLLCAGTLVLAAQAQAAQDDSFIKKATEGNLFEIEAAKLAQQNAQSDQVKQAAQQIQQDHQAANDQLQQIAQSQNVKLPTNPANQSELKKLSSLSGAEFDKEYLKVMQKEHKHDIKEFQKEAQKGKNAEAKNFAQQTVPKLQQHLQMVQQAQASISSGSAAGAGASGSAGQSSQ